MFSDRSQNRIVVKNSSTIKLDKHKDRLHVRLDGNPDLYRMWLERNNSIVIELTGNNTLDYLATDTPQFIEIVKDGDYYNVNYIGKPVHADSFISNTPGEINIYQDGDYVAIDFTGDVGVKNIVTNTPNYLSVNTTNGTATVDFIGETGVQSIVTNTPQDLNVAEDASGNVVINYTGPDGTLKEVTTSTPDWLMITSTGSSVNIEYLGKEGITEFLSLTDNIFVTLDGTTVKVDFDLGAVSKTPDKISLTTDKIAGTNKTEVVAEWVGGDVVNNVTTDTPDSLNITKNGGIVNVDFIGGESKEIKTETPDYIEIKDEINETILNFKENDLIKNIEIETNNEDILNVEAIKDSETNSYNISVNYVPSYYKINLNGPILGTYKDATDWTFSSSGKALDKAESFFRNTFPKNIFCEIKVDNPSTSILIDTLTYGSYGNKMYIDKKTIDKYDNMRKTLTIYYSGAEEWYGRMIREWTGPSSSLEGLIVSLIPSGQYAACQDVDNNYEFVREEILFNYIVGVGTPREKTFIVTKPEGYYGVYMPSFIMLDGNSQFFVPAQTLPSGRNIKEFTIGFPSFKNGYRTLASGISIMTA